MQVEEQNLSGKTAGVINAQTNTGAENTQMEKLHSSQGHGFAAERANHLYDVLHGKDAVILGDDNAKNGADRRVDGALIQSKYCQTASKTVSEAFENGRYRYLTPDGRPMQLEVPSDQYESAVAAMERRIAKGEVPGVTDPEKAGEIVRKGHFTYDQAKKLAQANTIESLTYDAVNGIVIAANTFGITATITFALSCWNGDGFTESVENAVCAGLQVGGASFLTNIAAGQLARAGLNRALVPATDALVKAMGVKSASIIANAFRTNANIYGQAAMNSAAKLIRCNAISGAVMTVVLSANDIGNAFRGRISGAQLFRNVATTAGGIAGGGGGLIIGTSIAGPLGGFIGAIAGGTAGSAAARAAVGTFVEDDAVRLMQIIEEIFREYAVRELLTGEETELAITELSGEISVEKLMEMQASPSKEEFAEAMVSQAIKKIIGFRSYIRLPDNTQVLEGVRSLSVDYEKGTGIFGTKTAVSAVEAGRQLTGAAYSEKSAKRAWYAVKQSNAVQKYAENTLYSMRQENRSAGEQLSKFRKSKNQKKSELDELLKGG